jgi:hypothetical protein
MRRKKQTRLDIMPPSGIFVRTPDQEAYYIKSGRAYTITEIHLRSWDAHVIPITAMALLPLLPIEGKLGFRDGTLVKDFADGKMYLVSDSKRRQITDPSVFEALGGEKRMISVPSEYIRMHLEGETL